MADIRVYPGLAVNWPGRTGTDDDPTVELVLAAVDDCGPTAADQTDESMRVFFASAGDRDQALAEVRRALPASEVRPIDVPDEQWAERSQAALQPIVVGALTVAPPWAIPAGRNGVIVIQPSMGFGTGHHASTRLCLRLLQEQPVAGASVLDAGTGSGVLAIAARALGAATVLAVDSDADAIDAARVSAGLNGVLDAIDIRQADLDRQPELPGAPFALILANLTGAMLTRLSARLCAYAAPGGSVIASGILDTEEDEVVAAFARAGATVAARLAEDEWIGLRLTIPRPPTPSSAPR